MDAAGCMAESLLEPGTPEGLQRISEANLKNGRYTKDKLAAQHKRGEVERQVNATLKLIEQRFIEAGLLDT